MQHVAERLLGAFLIAMSAGSVNAAELRLSFPALKGAGQIVYAVFDAEASWEARGQSRLSGSLSAGVAEVRLELPPGDYAVMAYHDKDTDQRLDTLPIGLPTEPYGFSNNSRGMFGPPSWKAAAFKLDGRGAVQTIRLR